MRATMMSRRVPNLSPNAPTLALSSVAGIANAMKEIPTANVVAPR